eukprot:gene13723-16182_t
MVASIYYLTACVCKTFNQRGKATTYLRKSLAAYPYLWLAYEQLAQLDNTNANPDDFYNMNGVQITPIIPKRFANVAPSPIPMAMFQTPEPTTRYKMQPHPIEPFYTTPAQSSATPSPHISKNQLPEVKKKNPYSDPKRKNAQTSYRAAIKIDPRHYNSWYGLGLIYFKQEKYDLAKFHFLRALSINGTSSVLFCYIGMTLQANKQHVEALDMLERALDVQPRNTLAKFKKASILYTLEQYELALQELEEFKELAPKETPVYILMGRVYKRLGQTDKALDSLTTALDMDHKNSNYIRSIIDKLHIDDDNDNQDIDLV